MDRLWTRVAGHRAGRLGRESRWLIRSPTCTCTPSSRCSTVRPGSARSWPRPRPTASRRSASPTTATCTGSSTSTRRARSTGIKPIIGTEAYMAHEHRTERPPRRGKVDDSGGDAEGGAQGLLPPDRCWPRTTSATRTSSSSPAGPSWRATTTSPRSTGSCSSEHSEGIIATTGCLGGHVLQALLRGRLRRGRWPRPARLQDIFGRDNLFVELQDHGIPEQHRTNPQLLEIAKQHQGAAARHQRQPLHPPRRRRRPRRPAVRADRRRS